MTKEPLSEFHLQLPYYIHSWTNTLGRGIEPSYTPPQLMLHNIMKEWVYKNITDFISHKGRNWHKRKRDRETETDGGLLY